MISARNLTLSFGEKQVLRGLNLTLPDRGITALLGPSGSGKTTLARILSGLQLPESGTVTGVRRVSFLFQEDRLLPWLTALENVAAPLRGVDARDRAARMLRQVELGEELDALPETLSGGMRRRVALARALCYPAELLLLDEPFRGLDEALQERLYPLLRQEGASRSVLLITHSRTDAQALADQIVDFSALNQN